MVTGGDSMRYTIEHTTEKGGWSDPWPCVSGGGRRHSNQERQCDMNERVLRYSQHMNWAWYETQRDLA